MIADSSAVVAYTVKEPGYERLEQVLAQADISIGAPTLTETSIVLCGRLGPSGVTLLASFLQRFGVAVLPFTDQHWAIAADAFLRFGKGRHPAALNLGDCLTYATARLAGEPLLCLGDDFAQTDLTLVAIR